MARKKISKSTSESLTPAVDSHPSESNIFRVTFTKDFNGSLNNKSFRNKPGDVIEVDKRQLEYLREFDAIIINE